MRTTLNTICSVLKTGFNYVAPGILYKPKFRVGDLLLPAGIEKGEVINLPRFGDDTLYSVLGGFTFKVAALSRGEYTSTEPRAEFRHTKTGYPHYEIEVLEYGGAFDNYRRSILPISTKIHVDAQIVDGLFKLLPKAQLVV